MSISNLSIRHIVMLGFLSFLILGFGFNPQSSKGQNTEKPQGDLASVGVISQDYHSGHSGVDIAAKEGTPIKSFTNGQVVRVGDEDKFCPNRAYGKYVMVEESNGPYTFLYAHMQEQLVSEGDLVKAGDILGRVGTTGLVTGPHLHLTIYKTSTLTVQHHSCGDRIVGETIDPEAYIKK